MLVFEHNMQFITEPDYGEAMAYLPNPEHYDFNKILNW
jgi:hypothetical protein